MPGVSYRSYNAPSASGAPAYSKRTYKQADVTPTNDSAARHMVVLTDRQEFFSSSLGITQVGPGAYSSPHPVEPAHPSIVSPSPSGFYQALFAPITPVYTTTDASPTLAIPLANIAINAPMSFATPEPASSAIFSPIYPWQWLHNFAQNYEEWQLSALTIEWVPLVSYQTLGQIVLSYTPDATALPEQFNSFQAMMSTVAAVSGSVWAAIKLEIPLAETNMPSGWKTVQSAPDSAASQTLVSSGAARGGLQQFFQGFIIAAFEGISTSIALPIQVPAVPAIANMASIAANNFIPLGCLKSTYSLALRAPIFMANRLLTSFQLNSLTSHFYAGPDNGRNGVVLPSATNPFGQSAVQAGPVTFITGAPAAWGQYFQVPYGRYQVLVMVNGSSALACAPAATGNGCTILANSVTNNSTPSVRAYSGFVLESSAPTTANVVNPNFFYITVASALAVSVSSCEAFFTRISTA